MFSILNKNKTVIEKNKYLKQEHYAVLLISHIAFHMFQIRAQKRYVVSHGKEEWFILLNLILLRGILLSYFQDSAHFNKKLNIIS